MRETVRIWDEHQCMGCGKTIADMEPHIHLSLNEFSEREGLDPISGLDIPITLCADCTEDSHRGWTPEAHPIEATP